MRPEPVSDLSAVPLPEGLVAAIERAGYYPELVADVVRAGKALYIGVSEWTAEQIRAGVDEAYRQGFPVPEALADFATLRSEMSACAREYRLTSDEVLALVEACEARSTEFWNTLGQAGANSSAARILQAGIENLSAARRKLLDRPL